MSVWVDPKGKIFTNVVQKDELPVMIQTVTGLIHGYVYLHPDQRLVDEMNGDDRFLAVTDAKVFGEAGQVEHLSKFLTLNKRHVVWIRPDDEAVPVEEAEEA
jgi:Family of unknown function (DUF6812)